MGGRRERMMGVMVLLVMMVCVLVRVSVCAVVVVVRVVMQGVGPAVHVMVMLVRMRKRRPALSVASGCGSALLHALLCSIQQMVLQTCIALFRLAIHAADVPPGTRGRRAGQAGL